MKKTTKHQTGRNPQIDAMNIFNQLHRIRVTPAKVILDGSIVGFDKQLNTPGARKAVRIKVKGRWRPIKDSQRRLAEAADMLFTRMKERTQFNQDMSARGIESVIS